MMLAAQDCIGWQHNAEPSGRIDCIQHPRAIRVKGERVSAKSHFKLNRVDSLEAAITVFSFLKGKHNVPDIMECPRIVGPSLPNIACGFVLEVAPRLFLGQRSQNLHPDRLWHD